MSYPYDLDLLFHSEKSSCDGIAPLSFSKLDVGQDVEQDVEQDVVDDLVILRSQPYSVSNDYTVSGPIIPSFNTQKEAYTEIEFKKSDWDSLPEEVKESLVDFMLNYNEVSVDKQVVTFCGMVGAELGIIFLSSEPFDIDSEGFPDCTLTSVTSGVFVFDDYGITYLSSCKVKTYIDGVENKDSSYIPAMSVTQINISVAIVEEDHT